ncbi:hypothetical protein B0T18DRAFT_53370 [Schizothecium vesticola]|uniref:Uncharacterized protein n=1 Tax=Schizothecium vesticola TaxID=314040 RepID=A0AA40FC78_9PEZI|nr:hypothetical protein B0T18DRAFT_53370 [Schizothecium vesticola]
MSSSDRLRNKMGLAGSPVGLLVVFTGSVIFHGLTHSLLVLLVCFILAFILENKTLAHPKLDKIRRVLGVKPGFREAPAVSDSEPAAGLGHSVSQRVCPFTAVAVLLSQLLSAVIPRGRQLPDEADYIESHPIDDSDFDPADYSDHPSDVDSDSDVDFDARQIFSFIEHMPLSAAHIARIPSASGTPQLHVTPRRPGYLPGTPFVAIQDRDETTGAPFVMTGLMPYATLRGMIEWCFGPPPQKMAREICAVEGGAGLVMFWVSDVEVPNLGMVLSSDLVEGEEKRDLTLEELERVLGKKKGEEE